MPRKDRSFTGEDILRFYCRNLSADQRAVVDSLGLLCSDEDRGREARLISLLSALTTPPLSEGVALLPGGNYIGAALDSILAVATGELDIEGIELIAGEFTFLGRDLGSLP